MTAHNHDRYVYGCYRCELGDDELAYAEDETLAECRELTEQLRMEAKEAEASARTADPVDTLWWDAAERLDDLVDWVERLRAGPNRPIRRAADHVRHRVPPTAFADFGAGVPCDQMRHVATLLKLLGLGDRVAVLGDGHADGHAARDTIGQSGWCAWSQTRYEASGERA